MMGKQEKKRRWEDRFFYFILRNRKKYLGQPLDSEHKIFVGQKIIYKDPVNKKIMIHHDRNSMRRFAIGAFIVFLLFAVVLLRSNHPSRGTFLVVLVIGFPFLVMGIAQYLRSKRKAKPWHIDLQQQKIVLTHLTIPFHAVSHFSITRLVDPNELVPLFESDYSYQLNLEMKSGEQVTLFTDEQKQDITDAGDFFEQVTGISFDRKVTNG